MTTIDISPITSRILHENWQCRFIFIEQSNDIIHNRRLLNDTNKFIYRPRVIIRSSKRATGINRREYALVSMHSCSTSKERKR